MKRLNKILAVTLAVLMTASLLCTPIGAADNTQQDLYASLNEGTGYVAIGDSFTRGYGAGDTWQDEIYLNDEPGNVNCRNVKASFPNLVADALGLNAPDDITDPAATFWSFAHDAQSTAYFLDLMGIDDGFRDTEFTYARGYQRNRYAADLHYFGDEESFILPSLDTMETDKTETRVKDADGYKVPVQYEDGYTHARNYVDYEVGIIENRSVRDIIDNAKLITIQLGQSDVIYKAQIFGFNELNLNDLSSLPGGIAHIFELLNNYFNYWKDAYPLLLDYIKEHNPDAKVILIGTMNPLRNATASDDFGIKIGGLLNVIMDRINNYTQLCALKYGYSYVDISDVETPSSAQKTSIGYILGLAGVDDIQFGLMAHPTTKGYAQIAERVVSVVNDELKKDNADRFEAFFLTVFYWFKNFFATFVSRFGLAIR